MSRREAGFALVPVLWAAALLGLIAGAVATAMRAETGIARAQRLAAEGRAIADAAIHLAVAQLLAADARQRPRLDGQPFGLVFDDQEVLLQVQDEAGKLDLNMAEPSVLRRYFAAALEDAGQAAALTATVLARRWPAPGAARFLSVAELGLLPGVTPAMLARLAPGLTVHAQQPGSDPATAVAEALLALPGMTAAELEQVRALRLAADGGLPREVLGRAVEIGAALERGGVPVRRRAVVRLVADPARPVWVYAWD